MSPALLFCNSPTPEGCTRHSPSFSAAPLSWNYTLLTLIGFLTSLASKLVNTHTPERDHPLG